MSQMSFDSKCYYLAKYFLEDEDDAASETEACNLAQTIQDAIEDWIAFRRDFKAAKAKAREAAP